jgi:hypothetical protein
VREPVGYSFPLPERRQVLGSLTAGQVSLLAGAALVAVFGIVRPYPGPIGVLAAVAWLAGAAAAVLIPMRGRPAMEWLPIAGRYALARVRGRTDFRGAAPLFPTTARLQVPSELGHLEVLAHPTQDGELGVVADRAAGLYTAALQVDGPPFLLQDTAGQEDLLARWGALLARTTQHGNRLHRLQVLLRSSPDGGDALAAYFKQARARDLDDAAKAVRSYLELLDDVTATSTRHSTLVVAQLAVRRATWAIRQAGGGDHGACAALADTIATLTDELADLGVTVRAPLDARAYQGALRVAFDLQAARDLDVLARSEAGRGWGSDAPWPLATQERWGLYRTADRAWHRSFTLALPLGQVGADWLVPLLLDNAGACRTVALTFNGVPRLQANRQVARALTGLRAEEHRKLRVGQLPNAHDEQREAATIGRMRELADGHGEVVYAVTVTVTAPDPDELESACDTVRHAAGLAGCELRLLEGQQAQAFGWSLPLARGVE